MSLEITSSSLEKLGGKVVLITGGSNGLGWAAVQMFSSYGALITIADMQPPAESIPNTIFTCCDVTRWESILSAFEITIEKHGRVDALVANAGVGELEDLFLDEFDSTGTLKEPSHVVIEVNLKGVINCVKVAIHFMKKQAGGGSIVMTSSSAGYFAESCLPVYSTTKHGVCSTGTVCLLQSRANMGLQLVGLLRSLRPNVSKFNITLNIIAPYMTESRLMTENMRKILKEHKIPFNKPENVAKAMAYLVTEPINGKTVVSAADSFREIEDSLADTEYLWMGEKYTEIFKRAERLNLFVSKSGL